MLSVQPGGTRLDKLKLLPCPRAYLLRIKETSRDTHADHHVDLHSLRVIIYQVLGPHNVLYHE